MTKVKICGITNLEDALLAVELGADSLGFNFYKKSSRYVSPEVAKSIIEILADEGIAVGVFVNEDIATISSIATQAGLGAIQLHGDESPEDLIRVYNATGLEIIKALRVGPDFDIGSVAIYPSNVILLDSYSSMERGGTGLTFDWSIGLRAQYATTGVVYLAGGLSPDNVKQAIREARPFGIDVCSGVESQPGKKDAAKMKRFFAAVRETV